MSVREAVRNSRVTERLLEELQKIAPYTDEYDVAFGAVLLVILGIGILDRFLTGSDFLTGSETLALITASTAFIALYRLRHSHEKRRPTVRPDYDPPDGNTPCDFGLRNYGPGPALYVQAVLEIRADEETERAPEWSGDGSERSPEFVPHHRPLHLDEGEFLGLFHQVENDWLEEQCRTWTENTDEKSDEPVVDLYYSWVSQAGMRVPEEIRTDENDECVLDGIEEYDTGVRNIPLSDLRNACLSGAGSGSHSTDSAGSTTVSDTSSTPTRSQ